MSSKTVIIVGAGIFGVTAALEFRRRGWHVHLVDPGPIPHPRAQSTGSRMMVRLDYRADEEYMSLAEASLEEWREWNRIWPEPVFHETGLLVIKRSPMTSGEFEYESYQTLLKHDHKPVRLNAADIRERFPAWNADRYVDGYFNPEGGYVDGGRVVAQLLQQAHVDGVAVHEGQSFASLLLVASRVVGIVTSNGSEFKADKVVVTAGAWIPRLIPSLASAFRPNGIPVFYLRPQHPEQFQPRLFPVFTADIAKTGYFGYPPHPHEDLVVIARQGRGRVVDPNDEAGATQGEIAHLRLFLSDTFPALFDAPIISTRFGPYSETLDGHLWIAADPEHDGLIVATGGDHAFKFAPRLGGLIADAAEGSTNHLLHKFRWRPEITPPII